MQCDFLPEPGQGIGQGLRASSPAGSSEGAAPILQLAQQVAVMPRDRLAAAVLAFRASPQRVKRVSVSGAPPALHAPRLGRRCRCGTLSSLFTSTD